MTITDVVTMIDLALQSPPTTGCAAGDTSGDGQITIDEILVAVHNSLSGCPSSERVDATPVAYALRTEDELAQQRIHQRQDNGTEERGEKTGDNEARHQRRREQQHEGVDHQ